MLYVSVRGVLDVCVLCLYCDAGSCRCSCMGSMSFVMQMLYVCVLCASCIIIIIIYIFIVLITGKRLRETEELQTYIPPMSHV